MPRFPHTGERLYTMRGTVPDLAGTIRGCAFATRCERYIGGVCDAQRPALVPSLAANQRAACHLYPGAAA
jgi:oligopeptide/dipeptide ABC transporter ATP-binding protein